MSTLSIETLSLKELDSPSTAGLQDFDEDFDKDLNPDGKQTMLL